MVVSVGDFVLTHLFLPDNFDAKKNLTISRKEVAVKGAKRAIIFYPYWIGKSSFYDRLGSHFPDSTQVFYDYPIEVYSEDVKVSLGYIREILNDSVKLIKKLRLQGIEEIVLVGSSLGSNIAFKVATMIRVEKVVLNMMDRDLAGAIFRSPAMTLLKTQLKQKGFTERKLKKVYGFTAVDSHLRYIKSKKTKFMFFVSNNDIFTPAKYFKTLFEKMDKLNIDYHVYTNHILGHVFSMYRNVNSSRMINFIED